MIARPTSNRYALAVATTVAMFATWGLAQRIHGSLVPQFEHLFALDAKQSALTKSTLGVAYLFLAIPSALFLRRLGYKAGVVFGLSGFALGAFLLYAAIAQHAFLFYLAAVATIGGSWALLETSANPLIVQMGPPQTAVRRLNLAQSFYPVGLLIGIWLGPHVALSKLPEMDITPSVLRPYVIVGLCVVLLAFLVDHIAFPPVATTPSAKSVKGRDEIRALLSRPDFRLGLVALTSYIVAQSCIWAMVPVFAPRAIEALPVSAAGFLLWSWIIYAAGRFIGTGLMFVFDSDRLLASFAATAAILLALAAVMGGLVALICLGISGFFMSIMFPTIFGSSIRDLGSMTKSGSGLLVTATGLGVTISAVVLTLVWSLTAIMIACSLCFAVVLAYALANGRRNAG